MNYSEQIEKTWDFLINYEIATQEELELVTNINGYNIESLNDVVYCRTGYHDLEQLLQCEYKNLYSEYFEEDEEEEEEDA